MQDKLNIMASDRYDSVRPVVTCHKIVLLCSLHRQSMSVQSNKMTIL